jgi:hypothetical protein
MTWLAARSGRQAQALALTEMMAAGAIAGARAEEVARMVLRDNAVPLPADAVSGAYRLPAVNAR